MIFISNILELFTYPHRETPAPDVIGGDVSNAYEASSIGMD